MRHRKPPELALPRRLLYELVAARTVHGDFEAYQRRLNHIDSNPECVYGQQFTPTYFFRCRQHTRQPLGHNCFEKYTEFARIIGCFGGHTSDSSTIGRDESIL